LDSFDQTKVEEVLRRTGRVTKAARILEVRTVQLQAFILEKGIQVEQLYSEGKEAKKRAHFAEYVALVKELGFQPSEVDLMRMDRYHLVKGIRKLASFSEFRQQATLSYGLPPFVTDRKGPRRLWDTQAVTRLALPESEVARIVRADELRRQVGLKATASRLGMEVTDLYYLFTKGRRHGLIETPGNTVLKDAA
jgi:hypothetical protein